MIWRGSVATSGWRLEKKQISAHGQSPLKTGVFEGKGLHREARPVGRVRCASLPGTPVPQWDVRLDALFFWLGLNRGRSIKPEDARMKTMFVLAAVLLATAVSAQDAQEPAALVKARAAYQKDVKQAQDQKAGDYVGTLKKILGELNGKGDAEGATLVQAEIDALGKPELPARPGAYQEPKPLTQARDVYEKALRGVLVPINRSYVAQLEAMRRDLGSKSDTVGAMAVQRELDGLQTAMGIKYNILLKKNFSWNGKASPINNDGVCELNERDAKLASKASFKPPFTIHLFFPAQSNSSAAKGRAPLLSEKLEVSYAEGVMRLEGDKFGSALQITDFSSGHTVLADIRNKGFFKADATHDVVWIVRKNKQIVICDAQTLYEGNGDFTDLEGSVGLRSTEGIVRVQTFTIER